MTPQALSERRRTALALLDAGTGVRQVARELGCSATAVIKWRDARANGHQLGSWDRYGTAGERYEDEDRVQARRRRVRRMTVVPTLEESLQALRHSVPEWLTQKRVRNAWIRVAVRLPARISGMLIRDWDTRLDVLFDVHHLIANLSSNADEKRFLQGFTSVTALLEFQALQLGMGRARDGQWKRSSEVDTHDRLTRAIANGHRWPPVDE